MAKNKKLQIFRILLLLGTAISLYFVPWPIVIAWIKPLPDTVQQQVDLAADYGFDGIVVCVNRTGNQSEFYTSGYKNKENKIPADPNALFKIASVSKLYNAVAVAKLVRDGKLDLDQTLAHYLPELKDKIAYADQITLSQMVMHRSGIPNFTDTYMYWANPKETPEEQLALVLDQPANFKPGEDYEYSNTNYLLLGRIMNRVLGYEKFQYIKEEILNPLELKHTFGSIKDVNSEDVMSGYYVGYDADLKTDNVGSILATAEDLSKFIRALNDGSVFRDQKEQELYASIYKFEHTGLIPGYQTIARYHRDIDVVVIQFTNTVNFEGYNWNMSELMYSRIVKLLK
ncbi:MULTISPECIES: serine hydrolase [unclassified Leeuwenhoekiella]|uniref:serine hydrolase domain-containing protein n=1 Tax=unclassified Leeuwenhoekiella TaxID=2615029 RepID=UPI000C4A3D72|nr:MULTISPECIES: serine hydrolase domain-containing protein [unclassified Leeuwenhoekiella]MAW94070.1 serine hydrolase [Leeuwenhoekiella sp.]MBA80891.1 serine hydrolase [Leeuwenhoekiella sp.]|tara:strand:- start:72463 stop:73491 length:1029 start_codon:yes stop_codon:yes gene_type:complete